MVGVVGAEVMVVFGGVVSAAVMVQVKLAGEASWFPTASTARTRKVWLEMLKPV